MPLLPATFAEDVINQPARAQFEAFLDEHRSQLNRCLDGLTEEQARQSLVPSRTTLLGLVKQAHREACESSRLATPSLGLDDRVYGYWRGPLPLRWVYLHVLRELAQHCGHADILREQILNLNR
jgi:Protein of unknown function (DUF664)